MKIEDLQETAALAHLNMDEKELAGAFSAFEQMLGYFAAMQAADRDEASFTASITGGTEGMAASSRVVGSAYFRPDRINQDNSNNNSEDLSEEMLEKAGDRDGRFVVIPNVL
ncbi:MAG: aspartyl/glutamyl-tRNA amidotransferase subunit C [Treponema sp.]|jgi:aspartyl-tRNA(Asn)/glutamyl-tRNA(Gln) amidotransferase subunit C|nr:aspartyl/glutamyl-tRNA amidotransferase subunit C [Treponema sp.]